LLKNLILWAIAAIHIPLRSFWVLSVPALEKHELPGVAWRSFAEWLHPDGHIKQLLLWDLLSYRHSGRGMEDMAYPGTVRPGLNICCLRQAPLSTAVPHCPRQETFLCAFSAGLGAERLASANQPLMLRIPAVFVSDG
jgi:hypothetical protein